MQRIFNVENTGKSFAFGATLSPMLRLSPVLEEEEESVVHVELSTHEPTGNGKP